ncbi:MAG: hypothetical protein NVS2B14_17660 [Chamaesiphon sp.]
MKKQTKEKEEPRHVGPKFTRNVLPSTFQIRRHVSPMADLLDAAANQDNLEPLTEINRVAQYTTDNASKRTSRVEDSFTRAQNTLVDSTPVKKPTVVANQVLDSQTIALPDLNQFIDNVLPLFPPAKQSILLRLYRWCEGSERVIVVSTPRLAAKTNMDEKACRMHLHGLIADGFVVRSMHGEHIAKFGGSDRRARGLILMLSSQALGELIR